MKALLLAVPARVVTVILPLFAPLGTWAWMSDDDFTANVAATPPNLTLVAPVKCAPQIATAAPARADFGTKAEITASGAVAAA